MLPLNGVLAGVANGSKRFLYLHAITPPINLQESTRIRSWIFVISKPDCEPNTNKLCKGEDETGGAGCVEGRVDLLLNQVHARGARIPAVEFVAPYSFCNVVQSTAVEQLLSVELGEVVCLSPSLSEQRFLIISVDSQSGAGD